MKKILITSYYFISENTPRAFRTIELAKQFSKDGYNVEVFIPNFNSNFSEIEQLYNIKVKQVSSGKFKFKKISNDINGYKSIRKNRFKYKIKKAIEYFTGGIDIIYAYYLYKEIKKNNNKYDMVISIGLPFSIHLGTYLGIKNKARIKVADYGDPFYYNSYKRYAFYFRFIERYIMRKVDYIMSPTINSKSAYKHIEKIDKKLKIIPQGFDFDEVIISKYKKNDITSFAYAGRFYDGIRNPKNLLDYLSTIKDDFRFYVYTDDSGHERLKAYSEKLGEKLIVNKMLSRLECIDKLSNMDFLINIENSSNIQIPSKLIDYSLSKRPILNINPENLDIRMIDEFMKADYSQQIKIDINKFNIKNVCKEIYKLL